ncbi:hypothetical protein MLD38_013727 [Melastoma candidum]|uniref:Uncharacterized protein n=1 Tax=Melastoma candidum TaxID=119954 RepID=A0ACB9RA44_9MYRT|nr:hypothetical protein MLD38_013727 [Melastoma candidum]
MEREIAIVMESIPGFKFHPSDEELLLQYLMPKIEVTQLDDSRVVPEVEVCKYDPWELPDIFDGLSMCKSRDGTKEWTFLCPRKRKYGNGERAKRTTPSGYWKVTGAERKVKAADSKLIGTKKTLVFYKGRVSKRERTNWVMHEYHLNSSCLSDNIYGQQLPYVASRIKLKKGKKGTNTNTDDYPTTVSNRSSPHTIDIEDYLQSDEANSSSCNTPASTGDAYHDPNADYLAFAYKRPVSSHHEFSSFPGLPQLDSEATPEYNPDNSSSVIYQGHVPPPPPPLFSPSRSNDYAAYFNWDYPQNVYN